MTSDSAQVAGSLPARVIPGGASQDQGAVGQGTGRQGPDPHPRGLDEALRLCFALLFSICLILTLFFFQENHFGGK